MKIKTSELIGAVDLTDTVCKALRRAWQLGQTYWQQADSESFVQHKKAETTHAAFVALLDDTRAALAAAPAQPVAQQGMAYAALPEWAKNLGGLTPTEIRHELHAFADATHALRVDSLAAAYREELDKLSQRNYELRLASHGQAPAVKREFTNELGNSIRITVEGPNSMHENIVTPMEAKQLREALNEHAQKSAPAGAMPECLTCSDHGAVGNILTAEPCPDCTRLNAQPAPATQQVVGNSGFDHKTAADFLNGKTVSDEAMRKFVAASRQAHDDMAGLQTKLLSERNELASREAEIALLKTELLNAEEAAKQGGAA